eukprot:6206435-Pleurochrysis_carterae.AAC.1
MQLANDVNVHMNMRTRYERFQSCPRISLNAAHAHTCGSRSTQHAHTSTQIFHLRWRAGSETPHTCACNKMHREASMRTLHLRALIRPCTPVSPAPKRALAAHRYLRKQSMQEASVGITTMTQHRACAGSELARA